MNIVVLIKQVPDTWSERTLSDSDKTLDRASSDAVLDEINERAVEEALKIKEAGDAEVTILTAGADRATDAVRKALSMGADKAVHVNDEAIHGSDAVATAKVLAKAIGTVGEVDLVLAGNEATDGRSGAMAGMIGEVLGWPSLTHANAALGQPTAPPRSSARPTRAPATSPRRCPPSSASARRSTSRGTPRSRGSWRPRRSR